MRKYVTMQDVAQAAGVSIATLDRILSGRSKVKRATIEHVMTVAQRLGYHGIHAIRRRLTEDAADVTFGFLLMSRERGLYDELARRIHERVSTSPFVRGKAIFKHIDTIGPEETIDAIRELAVSADAVAVHAADVPEVNEAVKNLADAGTPIFTLLSDLSSPVRQGHAGAEPLKIGRGVGWMVKRLMPKGGKVGLLLGSSTFMAHRGYADGIRSYLGEQVGDIEIVDAGETLESDLTASERLQALLCTDPNVAAIVVAGGGLSGVVDTLKARGGEKRHVVLGTELSAEIDKALAAGWVDAVLSHPEAEVVERLVSQMEQYFVSPGHRQRRSDFLRVEIRISETVRMA